MKTFIRKKILQEEDVENDEKKKNEYKQREISAIKDKPIQKELHEADTTKNKEFAKKQMILKMVDDRKTIFVLYILTHMKTRSL